MSIIQNLGQVSAFFVSETAFPPTTNVLWFKGTEVLGYDVLYWAGTTLQWQVLNTGTGGGGNITLQTLTPLTGGSVTPTDNFTIGFDINGLPVATIDGDESLILYNAGDGQYYKVAFSALGSSEKYKEFIATAGQTVFTLDSIPVNFSTVKMFVFGQKMRYSLDFTITGATLTYLNRDFVIDTGDEIEIYY